MIFLETDRLILRNVQAEDAAIMHDYRNNELCTRYQRGQRKGVREIEDLIRRRQDDVMGVESAFFVAVALKESNEMVGEIVVMPNDGAITIGYTMSYRHHRKGYAYESLSALTQLLHGRYPDWDFICFADPDNHPSIALLNKLGYQDYGYAEEITSRVFGKWVKGDVFGDDQ